MIKKKERKKRKKGIMDGLRDQNRKHPLVTNLTSAILASLLVIFFILFITNKQKNDESLTQNKVDDNEGMIEIIEDFGESGVEKDENWKVYKNSTYSYSISYPESWYLIDENGEEELKIESVSGNSFEYGGEVYWSNYEDISQFGGNETPEDLKLIALVVYKDENRSIEEFAELLGYKESMESYIVDIQSLEEIGKLYVLDGLITDQDMGIGRMKTTAIFKKDNLFYVFHIGLAQNEDEEDQINEIKAIISTFDF